MSVFCIVDYCVSELSLRVHESFVEENSVAIGNLLLQFLREPARLEIGLEVHPVRYIDERVDWASA